MITEDYISFETAKLLKEKGFNEPCHATYDTAVTGKKAEFSEYGVLSYFPYGMKNSDDKYNMVISAPTLQMAMKWFRIKHNILLFLLPAQENGKLVYLVEVWTWNEEEGIYENAYAPMPRKELEQAVEAAIKYCLEHLI